MPSYILDLAPLSSLHAFHTSLQETLSLAPSTGANLDALHDALTEDAIPKTILFLHSNAFQARFPDFFSRLCLMCRDSELENPALHITFLP